MAPAAPERRMLHERDAIATRRIGVLLALFVLTIMASAAVSFGVLRALGGMRGDTAAAVHADPRERYPAPRLQPQPRSDLARYRAEKNALLTTYRWIDRAHGIVGIPSERAMALVAARASAQRRAR